MSLAHLGWVALGGAGGAVLRFAVSWWVGANHVFPCFLVVGLLGGFTTFSAFSLETLNLVNDGKVLSAAAYVGSSVLMCLLAVWLGERASQVF
jgi:CrcB protein